MASTPGGSDGLGTPETDHDHRRAQLERLLADAGVEALVLGLASHVAWALCDADLRIQV